MASLRKTVFDIVSNGWDKTFETHDRKAVSDIVATFEPFLKEVATKIKSETDTELEINDLVSFGCLATAVIIIKESKPNQDIEDIVYPKIISFLANLANNGEIKEQLLSEYDLKCSEEACLGRECHNKICRDISSEDYLDDLITNRETLRQIAKEKKEPSKVLKLERYKK